VLQVVPSEDRQLEIAQAHTLAAAPCVDGAASAKAAHGDAGPRHVCVLVVETVRNHPPRPPLPATSASSFSRPYKIPRRFSRGSTDRTGGSSTQATTPP